jgi:hypothetical protein
LVPALAPPQAPGTAQAPSANRRLSLAATLRKLAVSAVTSLRLGGGHWGSWTRDLKVTTELTNANPLTSTYRP